MNFIEVVAKVNRKYQTIKLNVDNVLFFANNTNTEEPEAKSYIAFNTMFLYCSSHSLEELEKLLG